MPALRFSGKFIFVELLNTLTNARLSALAGKIEILLFTQLIRLRTASGSERLILKFSKSLPLLVLINANSLTLIL